MDAKYATLEITEIWSEEGRFFRMAKVEFANCEALYQIGVITEPEITIIRRAKNLPINMEVYRQRFEETRHDASSLAFALAHEVDRIAREMGSELRPG